MTIQELPSEQTYGYHVFYGRDGKAFEPRQSRDQIHVSNVGWCSCDTANYPFSTNDLYRRPISPGEGFELVPLDEVVEQGMEYMVHDDWLRCKSTCNHTARVNILEGGAYKAFRRRKVATIPSFGWVRIVPGDESTFPKSGLLLVQLGDGRITSMNAETISGYVHSDGPADCVQWLNAPPPPEIKSVEQIEFDEVLALAEKTMGHMATGAQKVALWDTFLAGIAFQKGRKE